MGALLPQALTAFVHRVRYYRGYSQPAMDEYDIVKRPPKPTPTIGIPSIGLRPGAPAPLCEGCVL